MKAEWNIGEAILHFELVFCTSSGLRVSEWCHIGQPVHCEALMHDIFILLKILSSTGRKCNNHP